MKDRYISVNAFQKLLTDYKNPKRWNTDVCDPDTVLRVLGVIENELGHFETIGPRQLSSKLLAAKDCAIEFYEKQAGEDITRYRECERNAEAVGNTLMMGLWRGMREATDRYVDIFKRLRGGSEK